MGIEISLEGQRALTTGASQGIGEAVARVFARAGAAVALCARREEALSRIASEIEAAGGRAVAVPADLTERAAAERVVARTVEALGGLDILVTSATVAYPARPEEVTDEDIDRATELKFRSGVRLARFSLPHLRKRPGCIVNVAGHSGIEASPRNVMGGIVNAAIINFSKSLSETVGPWGVRVNVVAPAYILTPRADGGDQRRAREQGVSFEEIRAQRNARTPLGRGGRPEEVAYAVAFLASDLAAYCTGANLLVDGGACRATPY